MKNRINQVLTEGVSHKDDPEVIKNYVLQLITGHFSAYTFEEISQEVMVKVKPYEHHTVIDIRSINGGVLGSSIRIDLYITDDENVGFLYSSKGDKNHKFATLEEAINIFMLDVKDFLMDDLNTWKKHQQTLMTEYNKKLKDTYHAILKLEKILK